MRSTASSTGWNCWRPGLVSVDEWRPDVPEAPTQLKIVGGVGRKA